MQQKSILKTVGLAVRLAIVPLFLLGFSSDVFAAVPTVGGINIFQQHPYDSDKQINWCDSFDDGYVVDAVQYVDDNDYVSQFYPEQSEFSTKLDLPTDHNVDCYFPNSYYQTPRGIPDESQGDWLLQFVFYGNVNPISNMTNVSFDWRDAEGDSTACDVGTYTEEQEVYSFGGETYTFVSVRCGLTQDTLPGSSGAGGYLRTIKDLYNSNIPDTVETAFLASGVPSGQANEGAGILYMTYTSVGGSSDIMQVSNATEAQQFLNAVNGHPWEYNGYGVPTGNWVSLNSATSSGTMYNTRFIDFVASATSTQEAALDVDYYIDPAEVNRSVSALNPTQLHVQYARRGASNTDYGGLSFDIGEVTGTQNMLETMDTSGFEDGRWEFFITFSNPGCALGMSDCPFPEAYISAWVDITAGEVTGFELAQNHDAIPDSDGNQSDFLGSITNFYANIINNKHPFAWVSDAIDLLKLKLLVPHDYETVEFTIDFASVVTHATSSDGMLDFTELQDLDVNTVVVASPIAEACIRMNFSTPVFNTCSVFRTIISYVLYIVTLLFIARLVHKLLVTDQN